MSRRFFTSDFHLGMTQILEFEKRPFQTIDEMNNHLIEECCKKTQVYLDEAGNKVDSDTIIHLGDLASFGYDRGFEGLHKKASALVSTIPCTFVNIKGNHDLSNRVKSLAKSMRTNLGRRYPEVSMSHYPSYDSHSKNQWLPGDVHLCGHVHKQWKHCLDLTNNVLNINVGVDVWNYSIVQEDYLIAYLNFLFTKNPDDLFRFRLIDGKPAFFPSSIS